MNNPFPPTNILDVSNGFASTKSLLYKKEREICLSPFLPDFTPSHSHQHGGYIIPPSFLEFFIDLVGNVVLLEIIEEVLLLLERVGNGHVHVLARVNILLAPLLHRLKIHCKLLIELLPEIFLCLGTARRPLVLLDLDASCDECDRQKDIVGDAENPENLVNGVDELFHFCFLLRNDFYILLL
nr:MAG TPA: hypothetical protein [Caudoviricetes sp.]